MIIKFLQNNIVFILFQFTIFILLIIQLTQLTIQFIIPALRNKIASFNKFLNDLKDKYKLTKATEKRLNDKIIEQTALLKELEKKIQVWHTSISEKKRAKEAKQEKFIDSLKVKKQQQYEYLTSRQKENLVLPKAIEQAREKLKDEYSSENGKRILNEIIKDLCKNLSLDS
jgi:hypothetical protein